jgi:hypothetical protein
LSELAKTAGIGGELNFLAAYAESLLRLHFAIVARCQLANLLDGQGEFEAEKTVAGHGNRLLGSQPSQTGSPLWSDESGYY